MALVGKAPLTVCRTSSQGFVQVYAGCQAPDDILPEDAKRLVREGYLEKVKDVAPDSTAGTDKPPTVEEILAEVGTDKAKATAALEQEKAADKPRTTLLEKLQAVADAD